MRVNQQATPRLHDWGDDPRRHTVREVAEYVVFLVLIFATLVLAHYVGWERS